MLKVKERLEHRKRRFKLLSLIKEWHDNAPLSLDRTTEAGLENFMLRAMYSHVAEVSKGRGRSLTSVRDRAKKIAAVDGIAEAQRQAVAFVDELAELWWR